MSFTKPRGIIGASEVAALFGESPWISEYALWCRETGLALPDDERDEAMQKRLAIGNALEKPVLEIWAEREGIAVEHNRATFTRPDVAGFGATPDAIVLGLPAGDPGKCAVVDVKTVRPSERKAWAKDGTPAHYRWQLQGQMLAYGAARAYLVALFSVDEIAHEEHKEDLEAQQRIRDALVMFWKRVRGELPPPEPDGHKATTAALMATERVGEIVQLGSDIWEETHRLKLLQAEEARFKKEIRAIKNKVLAALGKNSTGTFPDGGTWEVRRITVKPETKIRDGFVKQQLMFRKGEDAAEDDDE